MMAHTVFGSTPLGFGKAAVNFRVEKPRAEQAEQSINRKQGEKFSQLLLAELQQDSRFRKLTELVPDGQLEILRLPHPFEPQDSSIIWIGPPNQKAGYASVDFQHARAYSEAYRDAVINRTILVLRDVIRRRLANVALNYNPADPGPFLLALQRIGPRLRLSRAEPERICDKPRPSLRLVAQNGGRLDRQG